MEIRCKATRKFFFKIDIEKYSKSVNQLTGATVNLPLVVDIPCGKCKMIETYYIYPTHYEHIKSEKNIY